MSLTTERTEATEGEMVMAKMELPVSVSEFADIADVLSKRAKADGRRALWRQVGGCIEIYSTPDSKEAAR